MTNNVLLIGRLVSNCEIKIDENAKKYTTITLAIPRSYKNDEGMYDTDFIDVTLYGVTAEQTCEWCNKGDLIAIRGRIETKTTIDGNGNKIKSTLIIADKVSFLSCKPKD